MKPELGLSNLRALQTGHTRSAQRALLIAAACLLAACSMRTRYAQHDTTWILPPEAIDAYESARARGQLPASASEETGLQHQCDTLHSEEVRLREAWTDDPPAPVDVLALDRAAACGALADLRAAEEARRAEEEATRRQVAEDLRKHEAQRAAEAAAKPRGRGRSRRRSGGGSRPERGRRPPQSRMREGPDEGHARAAARRPQTRPGQHGDAEP